MSAGLTLLRRPGVAVAVATGGSILLVARPLMLARTDRPVEALVLLFTGLLIVGARWPAPPGGAPQRTRPGWHGAPIVVVGLAAFAMGRVLGGGDTPTPALPTVIALNTLAAVAEEAFFRRLVYESFLSRGPVVAVLASTTLFAIVHVTVYGLWVLPLDLAAGLVLSWQRWASRSWHVPALTHALANILVVI
ncbi:MAG: CPBP family intramembrane metalloprotease [Actinomycetota bacterium]|nr:CPBP family intramembrane metalloprotease [Actinomycetota bacterium]